MEYNNVVKEKQSVRSSALGQCPTSSQGMAKEEKLVKFVFSAIRADSISVAGTFNNWTPGVLTLKKDLVGVWRGAIYLKVGTYQYRFYVDGKWVNDPSARDKVPNEYGAYNTVLVVK